MKKLNKSIGHFFHVKFLWMDLYFVDESDYEIFKDQIQEGFLACYSNEIHDEFFSVKGVTEMLAGELLDLDLEECDYFNEDQEECVLKFLRSKRVPLISSFY